VDWAATRRGYSLACPTWNELEVMCNSAALAKFAACDVADLKLLPDDHAVWDLAAHYLACLCVNLILTVSPERIVLSGGVLLRQCLFPMVRAKTQAYLNGYIDVPQVTTAEVRGGEGGGAARRGWFVLASL
jgi:fructokinase